MIVSYDIQYITEPPLTRYHMVPFGLSLSLCRIKKPTAFSYNRSNRGLRNRMMSVGMSMAVAVARAYISVLSSAGVGRVE